MTKEQKTDIFFKIKKWITIDFFATIIVATYFSILSFLGETCLIKAVSGIECPCCGMTRALKCFLKADFIGYVRYNFLALPAAICFYSGLHSPAGKWKTTHTYICITVAAAVFARFLLIKFL